MHGNELKALRRFSSLSPSEFKARHGYQPKWQEKCYCPIGPATPRARKVSSSRKKGSLRCRAQTPKPPRLTRGEKIHTATLPKAQQSLFVDNKNRRSTVTSERFNSQSNAVPLSRRQRRVQKLVNTAGS